MIKKYSGILLAALVIFQLDAIELEYSGIKQDPESGVGSFLLSQGSLGSSYLSTREELPAGDYRLSVKIRGKAPFGARLSTFVASAQLAMDKPCGIPREWGTLVRHFRLEKPEKPVVLFRAFNQQIERLELKDASLEPFTFKAGENMLPENGLFRAEAGIAAGWGFSSKLLEENGNTLSDAFCYADTPGSQLLTSKGAPVSFEYCSNLMPKSGTLTFTVRARAVSGNAVMKLCLIADGYMAWTTTPHHLSDKWQEYSVSLKIPAEVKKYPYFSPRIDLDPNQAIAIAEAKLFWTPAAEQKAVVQNGPAFSSDFRSGAFTWNVWGMANADNVEVFLQKYNPKLRYAAIHDGFAEIQGGSFCSRLFPIVPNQDYTVIFQAKNAVEGKSASGSFLLIDGGWNHFVGSYKTSDEWKTFYVTGKLPPSIRNMGYVRIDAGTAPVLVREVWCVPDKVQTLPVNREPVRIDYAGNNIFDAGSGNGNLKIRFRTDGKNNDPLKVSIVIRDWNGKIIETENRQLPSSPDQTMEIPVDTSRRGVFSVEVAAGSQKLNVPYAVLKVLNTMKLKENPLAAHLPPNGQVYFDMDFLDRYLGFKQMAFTRFSMWTNLPISENPEARAIFRNFHKFKLLSLPGFVTENHFIRFTGDGPPTDAQKKDFADYIRKTLKNYRGCIEGLELFNEPELWRFPDGPQKGQPSMPPANVAEYYRIAREVIDETGDNVKLCGPVTYGEYGENFLKAGGGKYLDIYTFHGYNDTADFGDIYGKVKELRAKIQKYAGKDMPIWNSETYYGLKTTPFFENDQEYKRTYFAANEYDLAARCAINLIHHAAAGSKWANMSFQYLYRAIPGMPETIPTAAFGSSNAAIEMLSNAGTGEEIRLGEAVKCFLFPAAEGGAIATIHTPDINTKGVIVVPDQVTLFDGMGNRLQGREAEISGLPVYLKFRQGAKPRELLDQVVFRNLGAPFRMAADLSQDGALCFTAVNRTNQEQKITIELLDFPKAWNIKNKQQQLILEPGGKKNAVFKMEGAALLSLKEYPVKVAVAGTGERKIENFSFSTLFVPHADNFANAKSFPLMNRTMPFISTEKWGGDQDLSAKASYLWNEKGLSIAVDVTDDQLVFPKFAPDAYRADSLQIYFDMKHDASPDADRYNRNRSDDVDYIIGTLNGQTPFAYLTKGSSSRFIDEANKTTGIDGVVQVKTQRIAENQIRYEIFFPTETLPEINFRPGASFGVALLVNDNDGKGRRIGLTTTPEGTQPFQQPSLYQKVQLTR